MTTITRKELAEGLIAKSVAEAAPWPNNEANLDFLVAWGLKEGSHANWNIWDTEETAPGDSDYNPQGVKDYPSMQEGIDATWDTLINGRYVPLLTALEKGNSSINSANALSQGPWGTGNCTPEILEIEANRTAFYNQTLTYTGAAVAAPTGDKTTDIAPSPTKGDTMKTFIAGTPSGKGYWVCYEDGAIDSFGDAGYLGGANITYKGNPPLSAGEMVVDFTSVQGAEQGYLMLTSLTAVRAYGGAAYDGAPNAIPSTPENNPSANAS